MVTRNGTSRALGEVDVDVAEIRLETLPGGAEGMKVSRWRCWGWNRYRWTWP